LKILKFKIVFLSVKNGQNPDFEPGIKFSIKNYVGYNIVDFFLNRESAVLTGITPFFPIYMI